MTLTEKYRPKTFKEIKGQDEILKKIKNFIENFGKRKKAVILYGPPGIGKTTIAYVLANETNSEIFELNASDFRNKEKLKEILKPAIEQKSLTKVDKIILIDEADGISAEDEGGLSELITLIEKTNYPIIITANDVWDKKFNSLRKKCELIQLKEVDYKVIKSILREICEKEKLTVDEDILTEISIKARGDIRAAINDLQTISSLKDYMPIIFDERNKETNVFNALRRIFKEKPSQELLSLYDSINLSLDDIMLWIEQNIPLEYQKKELERAYDLLSESDVFRGRIYKQQYWRFLVYENILLSYGIASCKKNAKQDFTSYKKPTRILQIWMNNQRTLYKKTISEKYAEKTHVSKKKIMSEFLIIKQVINSNPNIIKELKLSDEEIEYLKI
jgi:replication factor C large subunit